MIEPAHSVPSPGYGRPMLVLVGCVFAASAAGAVPERLTYNRDIRPILSDNCFACHGPDAKNRQGDLRLDVREDAVAAGAIVPGEPRKSGLVERIVATDPDTVMPPPHAHKKLDAGQKQILARWIAEGAEYQKHWAYEPPVKPPIPAGADAIDHLVEARLARLGLAAAEEADRRTLIRRLSFDLVGLPPDPADVEAFVRDAAPDAYGRLVDRLLASPHYGERMAVGWLDVVRFADTIGYHSDNPRNIWPYRDWVIRAFNDNMPFDRFTIEQLAGDLLPNPTRDQRVATGFHRNHMLNEEGGVIAEEFLAELTGDRVETTATVWLGQTFNCCRCHNHKFDPLTQREFYSLKAFFHNVDEKGVGDYEAQIRVNAPPFLRLPTPEQEAALADLKARIAAAEQKLEAARADRKRAEEQAARQASAADKPAADAAEPKAPGGSPATAAADAVKLAESELNQLRKAHGSLEQSIPTALVMEERPAPRKTFILNRGDYSSPGEEVTAATPAALPAMAADLPKNRLGLARWLVAADNPLTPRVTVNRLWQSFFGTGLVATTEDFGSQGSPPSHPDLLDWLAVEFRETGWDVKRLVRLMVTSAAYRQASAIPPGLAGRDPQNRLLARGPRFRLQAEFVRDQAIAASGLLVPRIGGPSVKPYHPPGLYEQVVNQRDNPNPTYEQGTGEALHRRSLYTYWKRSVPHPAMLAFDAPFRETCSVKRSRTNTPMQALALMNDPTFVEASKFLAARMIREGGSDAAGRIAHGFWLVLARPPEPREVDVMAKVLERFRAEYAEAPAAARALLEVGDARDDEAFREPARAGDLAAYTLLANLLLCRDEAVTRN